MTGNLERISGRTKMANEHWYVLKVRTGFTAVVAQRLRKLNLEVFVPESKPIRSQEPRQFSDCVYCRFDLQSRETVIGVPGVLDILGTPEPAPIEGDLSPVQFALRFRL
jgi:hypothetical protein